MFVRTKDGVYEVSEKTKYAQYSIRGMTMVKNADFQYISNENILNQSENLEELCDEFVFVLNHSEIGKENEYMMIKKSNLEYFKLLVKDIKNSVLYGAIYTSKGLIYVAKMDNEGKLVLI